MKGLKLIWEDGSKNVAQVAAFDNVEDAGPQDLVILALKAHFLDQVARKIDTLMDKDTMIATIQNGIPWWYFYKFGGDL